VKKILGFTLVELLIVMAILGILATLMMGGYRASQMRGRDTARKSDLKQLSNSLELFYSDYGKYPAGSGTQIAACPYDSTTGSGTVCVWGGTGNSSEFRDTDGSGTKTTYFKQVPTDPGGNTNYYVYEVNSVRSKFRLYARLENTQDKNCINGNCVNPGISITCGGTTLCNYAATSTNTSPTDSSF